MYPVYVVPVMNAMHGISWCLTYWTYCLPADWLCPSSLLYSSETWSKLPNPLDWVFGWSYLACSVICTQYSLNYIEQQLCKFTSLFQSCPSSLLYFSSVSSCSVLLCCLLVHTPECLSEWYSRSCVTCISTCNSAINSCTVKWLC